MLKRERQEVHDLPRIKSKSPEQPSYAVAPLIYKQQLKFKERISKVEKRHSEQPPPREEGPPESETSEEE